MKTRSLQIFISFIIICVLASYTFTSSAEKEGYGDSFSDGDDCTSCHEPHQHVGLGAGYSSITIGESEPSIFIRVRVEMANIPAKSQKYGVILLSSGKGNLSDDGWTILSDPNGNEVPINYIERTSSDNSLLEWQVKNSPGNHTIKVMAMFGSDSNPYFKEVDVKVPISKAISNTPPKLSNPRTILLADGKTWDFEVTYSDINHDRPKNITVNISGLGSFEMEEKPPGPYNVSEGVTFYYLTNLPEGRYSYDFAAYDGISWNSTSNSVFNTFEEKEDIDITPLVLGVFAGFIMITGICLSSGADFRALHASSPIISGI